MRHCDTNFDLKINIGQHDLYFKVYWFCLISSRLFDGWTSWLIYWISVTQRLTSSSICRSVTYILGSIDFAPYLEDYLMEKCCTWDNGSVWHQDWPLKIYQGQWPIFHRPFILPFIIVIDLLFVYIKKWHWPGVFVPLQALALVL